MQTDPIEEKTRLYNFKLLELSDIEKMNNFLNKVYPSFFDYFELVKFIHCGYKSIIYTGKTKSSDELYCFKFCFQNFLVVNDYLDIMNQALLHSRNISEIKVINKINNTDYFIVSEYGQYRDLEYFMVKFMKTNYLSETFINYITKQILDGLNYMQSKHIIHMNIKESKIILDSELNAKLIDFSTSLSFNNNQPDNIIQIPIIGDGYYIPPEILNKKNIESIDKYKIDIYSLGVTLYHLSFGFYPFGLNNIKRDDYENIAERVNNSNLEFPNNVNISRSFKIFLANILDKDYKKRYNIREALEDKWIKGWDIINEEKENNGINENFILKLIKDNIPKFSNYIK